MPAVQTTYANFVPAACLGMVANGEWVTNIVSRIVDPAATAAVAFGDPVLQGAGEQLVLPVAGATGAFRGIVVRDTTLPPGAGDAPPPGTTIGLMTKGVIWVAAATPVSPGQAAYYTPAGALTAAATGNTAIPGALWESATTSAGLAKLRLG